MTAREPAPTAGHAPGSWLSGVRTWVAPEIGSIGRLPMRSPLVPYPDAATARPDEREASPWFRLLDGTWRFTLADRPEVVPADFADPAFDDSGWGDIAVPGNWTVQGWDRPHYTNIVMPFPQRPPDVPDENPTGLYRTTFRVPREWNGRRIVLHIGGAESVRLRLRERRAGRDGQGQPAARRSSTSPTRCVPAGATRWRAWSCAGPMPATSRTRTSGGWAGCTARCTSTPPIRPTSPTCRPGPVSTADADGELTVGTLEVRTTVGFADPAELGPGWRTSVRVERLDGRAAPP